MKHLKFRVFWDVAPCSQVGVDRRLRGADDGGSTSETSVTTNLTTRRYIPGDSKLHTRRRENVKSHNETSVHCHRKGIHNVELSYEFKMSFLYCDIDTYKASFT
jgi:hypothetical protein